MFVAGDDQAAKQAVSDIVLKGGFEPVDSGPLSNARFLEPVGEMNIHFGFVRSGVPVISRKTAGDDRSLRP